MDTGALPVHLDATEVAVVTDQCQRWRDGRHSFVRTRDGGFDPRNFTVEHVDAGHAEALAWVAEHHYSGTVTAHRHIYELKRTDLGNRRVGVAVFSVPMSEKVVTKVFPDLDVHTGIELGRLVLEGAPAREGGPQLAPANSESWFVARCLDDLATRGLRGVIAFADPVPRPPRLVPGHTGVVYQALGGGGRNGAADPQTRRMRYTGRGTARYLVVLPDGRSLPDRALQKVRAQEVGHEYVESRLVSLGARTPRAGEDMRAWLRTALEDVHARRLRHRGNHRFAMPLGTTRAERRDVRIALPPQPYPQAPDPT